MRKQLFDIAVCDDVQTDREETAQLTEEICKAEGIVPRIVRFERAEALLEAIQGGEHFALLLIDVLRTWMMAGGITESGKRISGREKTKAMQHLSLAVESYEHYVKNRDRSKGGRACRKISSGSLVSEDQ